MGAEADRFMAALSPEAAFALEEAAAFSLPLLDASASAAFLEAALAEALLPLPLATDEEALRSFAAELPLAAYGLAAEESACATAFLA